MQICRFLGICVVSLASAIPALADDAVSPLFEEMAATTGLDWMRNATSAAPLSWSDSLEGLSCEIVESREVTVTDVQSGRLLRQTQRLLPELGLYHLVTHEEGAPAGTAGRQVNVMDWEFKLFAQADGASFQPLTHSADTWYDSTFWTGPDWTRVGRDWQHSGTRTSSVRRFDLPRDGAITISGPVFKADTNGGDGVRVSIRHNSAVVWQQEIDAADAQGIDPLLRLDVRRGDRLRFVVHRRGEITCDTTLWDPVIAYADGTTFRASDAFGSEMKDGWSYEMEVEEEVDLPRLYSFDHHFCFRSMDIVPGNEIVLDERSSLPIFILADDQRGGGIAGAVISAEPWRLRMAFSEQGRLSLRVQGDGPALPEVVVGPYTGNWMQAAATLERLRRGDVPALNPRAFQEQLASAFAASVGALDPRMRPELDLWAATQWDWHLQDELIATPQAYEAAIAKVQRQTEQLAADLGVALPDAGDSAAMEPCQRYLRAHAQRRAVALSNPLLNFGELLFCKRVPTSYSHLVMQYYGWRARPGGGLFVLEEPGYSFAARDIFDGALETGCVLEPRLSYDAQRVVFSYVENAGKEYDYAQLNNEVDEGFYHLWEAKVDGTGLRQITSGPYDDLMPTYLPDGGIAFSSTRRKGYARCFGAQFSPRWHVYTLHRVEPDGRGLRILSLHDTNEWFPAVANDGMILYSRWDYIDRDAVTHQNLWATRPDGTNPAAIWGNATDKPHCTFQIQPIPNSRKIVFTAAAHHSITGGPIVVLDPTIDNNGQDALTHVTPGAYPEAETRDISEYYDAPWPLSEKYFLVSYSPWPLVWEPGANRADALGIYVIDVFGNRELIYRDPEIGSTNAVPLVPRPVPPVLSSTLPEPPPETGEALVADVYQGLGDIPRGTIKSLRIVQIFPKTTPVAGTPPIGLAGEENARAVLGEVPVEADGSARFTLPAHTPVLFQALDENGMAYQTMRSLTYVQPGEKVSCVGCHEPQKNVPPTKPAIAAMRPPSAITPGPLEGEPFSYPLIVQPILDKHCVECHSGPEPKGGKSLTGEPEGAFTRSYLALCDGVDFSGLNTNPDTAAAALVPRFGARNQVQVTPPGGAYGARGSRLMRMLQKGHHDVQLDREELRRLGQWIDSNAVFYGAYAPEDQARQINGEHLEMPELK